MSILFTFDTSIQLTRAATNQFGKIKMATKSIIKRKLTIENQVQKLHPKGGHGIFHVDFKEASNTNSCYVWIGTDSQDWVSVRISNHAPRYDRKNNCDISVIESDGQKITARLILSAMINKTSAKNLEEVIEHFADEEYMDLHKITKEDLLSHLSKFL